MNAFRCIVVCCSLFVFIIGCTESKITVPIVTDNSPALASVSPNASNIFTANVTANNWKIVNVFVRYTKHHWPGFQQANEGVAEPFDTITGNFSFTPSAEFENGLRNGDVVYHQWFVEYQLQAQTDLTGVGIDC